MESYIHTQIFKHLYAYDQATFFQGISLFAKTWVFIGRTDAEAETPVLWPSHVKN